MTNEGQFGSSLQRAFRRFNIPQRLSDPEEKYVVEERRVHTSAYDQDKGKAELLGPMTPGEERLFKAGGFVAVIAERKAVAKERGIASWREIGKSRFTVEETKETKTDERSLREMVGGTGQGPTTGKEAGSEEQANRTPERVSVLPSQARQGDRATAGDEGRDSGGPEARPSVRPGERTEASRTPGIREGIRPSTVPSGKTEMETTKATVAPIALPGVQAKDRTGSETSDATTVEAKRVNKGGRPRSTRTAEEIREANRRKAKAYRERKRGDE